MDSEFVVLTRPPLHGLRAPLNGLQPRTQREAARNPMDWWEPPQPLDRVPRLDRYAGVALAIAIGVALTLVIVSRLG